MKVYKCLITGDELFTDTYPVELKNGLYKVKGKYVTRSDNIDESALGANPSAEEAADVASDNSVSGINIVLDSRLQPTCFGLKKEYFAYFKDFVKALEEIHKSKNPDLDVTQWRKEITDVFKTVSSEFKEWEFYTGESGRVEGNIALVKWETPEGETNEVPYAYFFEQGVKEEKV